MIEEKGLAVLKEKAEKCPTARKISWKTIK